MVLRESDAAPTLLDPWQSPPEARPAAARLSRPGAACPGLHQFTAPQDPALPLPKPRHRFGGY